MKLIENHLQKLLGFYEEELANLSGFIALGNELSRAKRLEDAIKEVKRLIKESK